MASRRVVIEFLGQDKSASKTADDVEKKTSKLGSTMAAVGKTAAVGLAGGIVVGTVALAKMTQGAAEDQAAQERLAKTLKNAAGATDAQVAAIEDYISKTGVATGVTDDEMRPALANLVRATGDVNKAQGLMGLAMDVSAGTGKSLESVTMALAKAQNGSTGALGKLGIATKDASGKALTFDQIQKNLAKTFGGQAATNANTLEGKMARLKLIFAETQETIGAKLLPVVTRLADWFLNKVVPALGQAATWAQVNLLPALQRLGAYIRDVIFPVIAKFVTGHLAGLRSGFNQVKKSIQDNEPQLRKFYSALATAAKWIAEKLGPLIGWLAGQQMKWLGRQISGVITAISLLVKAFSAITSGFTSAWKATSEAFTKFLAWVGRWKGWVTTRVSSLFSAVGTAFGNVWTSVSTALTSFMKWVGGWKQAVTNRVSSMFSAVTTAFGSMRTAVGERFTAFVKWVGGWKTSITAWLGGTGKTLYDAGWNLISGLKNGVLGAMKGIGSWVKGQIVDPMVNAVKNFFGIHSPSRVFEGIGGHLIGGLMKGMGSGRGTAIAKKVFGDMPSALRAVVGKGLVGLQNLPKKALDILSGGTGINLPPEIGVLSGQNRRVFYQGEALDLSTYRKVKRAEALLGGALNITQGSYERASSFSGSTHTGGGVFDVVGGNLDRINAILRSLGFASWVRQPWQGPWPRHIHAIERGNPSVAPSAARQVADFMNGGDGLGGYKQGTPWVPNDQLAFLHKGEAVVPAEVNRRGIGTTVVINVNGALDPNAVAKQIQQMLVRLKKLNGGLELGLA